MGETKDGIIWNQVLQGISNIILFLFISFNKLPI